MKNEKPASAHADAHGGGGGAKREGKKRGGILKSTSPSLNEGYKKAKQSGRPKGETKWKTGVGAQWMKVCEMARIRLHTPPSGTSRESSVEEEVEVEARFEFPFGPFRKMGGGGLALWSGVGGRTWASSLAWVPCDETQVRGAFPGLAGQPCRPPGSVDVVLRFSPGGLHLASRDLVHPGQHTHVCQGETASLPPPPPHTYRTPPPPSFSQSCAQLVCIPLPGPACQHTHHNTGTGMTGKLPPSSHPLRAQRPRDGWPAGGPSDNLPPPLPRSWCQWGVCLGKEVLGLAPCR